MGFSTVVGPASAKPAALHRPRPVNIANIIRRCIEDANFRRMGAERTCVGRDKFN